MHICVFVMYVSFRRLGEIDLAVLLVEGTPTATTALYWIDSFMPLQCWKTRQYAMPCHPGGGSAQLLYVLCQREAGVAQPERCVAPAI